MRRMRCWVRETCFKGPQQQVQLESHEQQIVFTKRPPILPHLALGSVHNNKFNMRHMGFSFWLKNAQTHLDRFPKLRAAEKHSPTPAGFVVVWMGVGRKCGGASGDWAEVYVRQLDTAHFLQFADTICEK